MSALELHRIKGGRLEKSRYISHEFDDGSVVKFRVDTDGSIHSVQSPSKKATVASRVYKKVLCPFSVETKMLDFYTLDQWVADNSSGLWFRGGFSVYNFQHEEDAILFKLTWCTD